jgi:hypothetical protein
MIHLPTWVKNTPVAPSIVIYRRQYQHVIDGGTVYNFHCTHEHNSSTKQIRSSCSSPLDGVLNRL